jgi:hypothetical protein
MASLAQISAIDDYRSPKPQGVKNSGIERLLAEARVRLVETGTRNRLVHTPRAGKRTRSLAISGADADELFEILNQSTRALRFQATFPDDAQVERITVGRKTGGAVLQTNLAEEPLAKRLLTIYRDARTAEEEQGINILFLAIGFLRWYEDDKSEVQREAPLVLVPVSLERDVRRSTFDLKVRDEDITTNQAIQERLRTDFGIALPNLPETEDWQPGEYFAAVREAIAVKPRWSVDANGLELGFYSFSKLLMIRDLEPTAWGDKPIIEHPLLRALLSEGFREESALLAADAKLDTVFKPADLIQVVDADSSQTIVIETVRAGRNVVVQGPPGTGKSQTITNIIASAVHDGKSVLFVAEKMAALDVVHARLQRAGLGPICLELHSRGANKRKVLAEVESTLAYNAAEPNAKSEEAHLAELRTVLNTVDERMHKQIGETGLTPFQAISSLISAAEAGIESYHPLLVHAAKWSASDYGSVIDAAERLSEITATAGPCVDHPFYGVEATELQPTEIARLLAPLTALAEAATALAQWAETMADRLAITCDASLDGCASILALLRTIDGIPATAVEFAGVLPVQHILTILAAARAGLTLNDLRSELADIFLDAAFDLQVGTLRQSLTSGLSFFGRLGSDYRNASKTLGSLLKMPLPKKAAPRIALTDRLIAFAKHQTEFLADVEPMGAILPVYWRGSKTDFLALREAASAIAALVSHDLKPHIGSALELATKSLAREHIRTVTQLLERLNSAASIIVPALRVDLPKAFQAQSLDVIPLRSLAAKAHLWISETTRFDEWRRLSKADSRLRDLSGTVLADALSTGTIHPNVTAALLRCTFAEAAWAKAREASPTLQDFYGPRHDELASEFRALEAKRRITTARLIQHRHAASMPRGNYGAMNIIRSQVKLKRGHMPIRKLFKTAGETLQRIKPVLLMSPISVAQFLPPGSVQFDLLVIDEASQVRPEDALGVVARAKQIVVVGDNKQLPPTSFFDRIVSDDDENDDDNEEAVAALGGAAKATELESILALCEARGLNSAMLRWHYRSRHPSLIEVSNAEFYKHLIMPPAPSADRLTEGLMLRRVAGAYDRGGKRINTIEADAIVVAVAHHARKSPQLSLGIVTFSTAQRDAIDDRLDTIRQTDDALDAFLREGKVEDVFVKNLENVQGDERDVILVSVGYGPRVAGARLDSMAFGPVSGEGGLNPMRCVSR